MIGIADLHLAVNRLWDDNCLDEPFHKYWSDVSKVSQLVLNDSWAVGGIARPYCIYQIAEHVVDSRSSSDGDKEAGVTVREYRTVPLIFRIYADDRDTSNILTGTVVEGAGKKVAAAMAEEVMIVYGGHPEYRPKDWDLDYGGVLNCQFQGEFGYKPEDEEEADRYIWEIRYNLIVDVPVAV